ncbi:hypothetical protein QYE76_011026 [Lolium multiflorum]|uniref:CCHC-type domain-containing protein n=1 Tax=Lolium multiflorum TaxID=4521 RepID=A0AAD8TYC3_LOLMU|nr:hypothetical protein QYE76_011026 [Lolium multiflorum]
MNPPLSSYLKDILASYHLQLAQLHPNVVLVLAIFQLLREDFVSVMPSVPLFRHYFVPRVELGDAISGGVTFCLWDRVTEAYIPVDKKKWDEWQISWRFVRFPSWEDIVSDPSSPPSQRPGWGDQEEDDEDLIMVNPTINFNSFLEKEKLKNNGSNFTDWFCNLRIVLTVGQLLYVLDAPLGDPPAETTTDEAKNVYLTRKNHYSTIQCAILYGLESELQKRFETHDPHDIINDLKMIFETHAAVESYDACEKFFNCKMEECGSVSEHVLKMSGHVKKLQDLGITIPNALGIHCVLQSLPPSYKNFVMNYNMQCMDKTLPKIFSMLKTAEVEIKKEHQVLMVNKTTKFKKQGKHKEKGKFKKGGKKADAPPNKPKAGPKSDTVCYYCKEEGHWKLNCSKYLADLKSDNIKKERHI